MYIDKRLIMVVNRLIKTKTGWLVIWFFFFKARLYATRDFWVPRHIFSQNEPKHLPSFWVVPNF